MDYLDVIVPVHNEELEVVKATVRTVRQGLMSVQGVTIIFVDDGSYELGLSKNIFEHGVAYHLQKEVLTLVN